MSTYKATFYLYYDDCSDACRDYAVIKEEFEKYDKKIEYAYKDNGQKFWINTISIPDLTAAQVMVHDAAMKLKFRYYDGWDVDTKNPGATARDFGYNIRSGQPPKKFK